MSDADFQPKEDDVATPDTEEAKNKPTVVKSATEHTELPEINKKPIGQFNFMSSMMRKSVSIHPPKSGIDVFLPNNLGLHSIEEAINNQNLIDRRQSNNTENFIGITTEKDMKSKLHQTVSEEDENPSSMSSVSAYIPNPK